MKEPRPPNPPKHAASPKLYMTPHLAKRKDGLCPSLMQRESSRERPGYEKKSYRTNSNLLLQVKERDGIPKELTELQTIIECVTKALKSSAKSGDGICSLSFKPEGCVWKMEFDSKVDGGRVAETYKVQVICSASKGHGHTNYMVDTVLVPKKPVNPDPLAPAPPGFKVAKPIFDLVALKIRKSVVALEFPEFPEGCKGRPFRDIYQLNARVSLPLVGEDLHSIRIAAPVRPPLTQIADCSIVLSFATAQVGFFCHGLSRNAPINRTKSRDQVRAPQGSSNCRRCCYIRRSGHSRQSESSAHCSNHRLL